MILTRTADRQRLDVSNRSAGCPASSAGLFVIRGDGTSRFDRHHHTFDEFWLVASGAGTVLVADTAHHVIAGDIIYTPAGCDHDILAVAEELRIFWLSTDPPDGETVAHLHRRPQDAVKHLVPVRAGDGHV